MSSSDTKPAAWTAADVEAFLPDAIAPVRTGLLYHLGLIAVAASLVILQTIYLAMVALAGYATWLYVSHIPVIFGQMQLNFLSLILIATPLVAGVVVTFFLFKPLLSKTPASPELIHLDPAGEPVLFAFVARLCRQLGAPVPARIDVDLRVNASAALRRGWRSFFSTDLVLTIGLPLAAGLDVRQFAGVIAHEFGHFSQHAGMRLYFLIGAIRVWFARVAWERDRFDAALESWRKKSGWRTKAIFTVAWVTVEASRYILRGLLYCANIVSAWFSRQMEFDADRHAAALAGGESFAQALGLLPVLDFSAQTAWQSVNRSWKSQRLCDDFALLVRHRASALAEETRNQIVSGDSARGAGRWSTHPSAGVRVARIESIDGVATSRSAPAEVLFSDFGALCRKATLHTYRLSLGEALGKASLRPAGCFFEETEADSRRAEAIQETFGPVTVPSRWFRLPEGPRDDGPIKVFLSVADESTRYWSLLEESLLHHAALAFIRAGGRVNPVSFRLSSAEPAAVEAEERASRAALFAEIARLRDRFLPRGYFLESGDGEWLTAWATFSAAQDDLLELRYRVTAMRLLIANAHLLQAAKAASGREAHLRRVRETCSAIIDRFSTCPCPPLEAGDERSTLAEQLMLADSAGLTAEALADRMLERADLVGDAILGELCLGESQ